METLLQILNGDMGTLRTAVSTIEKDLEKLTMENERANRELRAEREANMQDRAGLEQIIAKLKITITDLNDNLAIAAQEKASMQELLLKRDAEIDRLRREMESREAHYSQQIAILKDDFLSQQRKWEANLAASENEKLAVTDNLFLVRTENDRLVNLLFDKVVNFKNKITKWSETMTTTKAEVYKNVELLRSAMLTESEQIQAALKGFARERERMENEAYMQNQKISELETKVSLIHNEKEKLSRLNMEKEREIAQLTAIMQENERKRQDDFEERVRQLEEEKRAAIERREREISSRFQSEKAALESSVKQLKQRVLELENQNTFANVELDRVNQKVLELETEAENWKGKFDRSEEERSQQIEEITMEFETYKRAHFQASELEIKFNAERTSYQTEIMQLKQKLAELDTAMRGLKNENTNLQELSYERMREIENWRNKLQLLGDISEVEKLRQQVDTLKRSNLDEKETNLKLNSEKKKLETLVKQLENEIQDKNVEVQRAYDLISELKDETGGTSKQADDSRREVVHLKGIINNLEAENLIKKEGLESLRRENEDLKLTINSLRGQIDSCHFDMNSKSRELQNKIDELDVIKRKYEDALNSVSDASILGSKIKYSIKKETSSSMSSSILTESNYYK